MSSILLAGEQVTGLGFEIKGFDIFSVSSYKTDGDALYRGLLQEGHEVTWMETSQVPIHFPETMEELASFDVVILSDVGANSLLFHPEMLSKSLPHPNRLKLLCDYVRQGGGLAMVGGWMSFSGIDGKAKYHDSFLEEALPVKCLPYDDRQERPEGVVPTASREHPILAGLEIEWPYFLGYNKVTPKEGTEVLLEFERDPLLVVWQYGAGRSAAFTSDCAPHWGPAEFLNWSSYSRFWSNLVQWLADKE